MKILLLAPQPFYQERGTPIAIKLLLEVLSGRGDQVDVLTLHEGEDLTLPGVTIHRTPALPFLKNIRPGFSPKKLICDTLMLPQAIRMAARGRYDYVHAVEEAAFIAVILKLLFGIPFLYDMDSSLSGQLTDKIGAFKPLLPALRGVERWMMRRAAVVVPVCDSLRDEAARSGARKIAVLYDVPLPPEVCAIPAENVRAKLGLSGVMALYIGNLELYQGIDLLLESFWLAAEQRPGLDLVIIGGKPADIDKYTGKARELGIEERVHFLGAKPVALLSAYLEQADILVSPRIKGSNTPMKLYSYLQSGKPVLATNLSTHTQVLDPASALLTDPHPRAFAEGLIRLAGEPGLRTALGAAGRRLIDTKYNYDAFCRTFASVLADLERGVR
ncbi:MAG: glycosyltransferase family 4 protein [Anaerolinea sp.]|nr:glycosyltransferase family 4 protein [Anaerolinea sp.]